IRVLDGPLTDSMEAIAFNKHYQINDIYSCSWGPDDDGKTVDGPHQLGKAALQHGGIAGRRGFGSIFVVASGNGGQHSDNCNYDGYANSIYTVTIGAVDETGSMPFYAEECASMLAVTFSGGGDKMMRSIVSTTHVFPCALLATPDSPEQRRDEALSLLMATRLPEA
ncbi:LOW QUALITY PROTEIN: proprotein convertase subtilisin/kexin type 7-like, partial [Antrostomus carolinensis]|uniref:LOW QUALITY PROTEIN: proprotein convertase subtilisin/kexin type 7-like n=1 Tax=Antrostomus carolinensis TaxID=279965 RepID=UPI00052937BC